MRLCWLTAFFSMLFLGASESAMAACTSWQTLPTSIKSIMSNSALFAEGTGDTSLYLLQVDPATCAMPVSITGSVTVTNPSVGPTGSAVPASATFMAGKNAGNLVGVAVDSSGDIINDNLTAAATFQAEGSLAAGSLTTNFQTVVTTGGVLKAISIRNSCNQPVGISLDGGTTLSYVLEQNDAIAIDLKTNGLKVAAATLLQAKYTGSAPTTGTIRINATY